MKRIIYKKYEIYEQPLNSANLIGFKINGIEMYPTTLIQCKKIIDKEESDKKKAVKIFNKFGLERFAK